MPTIQMVNGCRGGSGEQSRRKRRRKTEYYNFAGLDTADCREPSTASAPRTAVASCENVRELKISPEKSWLRSLSGSSQQILFFLKASFMIAYWFLGSCSVPCAAADSQASDLRVFKSPTIFAKPLVSQSAPEPASDESMPEESPSSSFYESVRALDKYGHAVQLKHAATACDRRGRFILAFVRRPLVEESLVDDSSSSVGSIVGNDENCTINCQSEGEDRSGVWVVTINPGTLQRALNNPDGSGKVADVAGLADPQSFGDSGLYQRHHRRRHRCPSTRDAAIKNGRLIQLLYDGSYGKPRISSPSCYIAVVCTGVGGDASWLVDRLRSYERVLWERYDDDALQSMSSTNHHAVAVTTALSSLLRQFWSYSDDVDDEDEHEFDDGSRGSWQGPAWDIAEAETQAEDPAQWSRPLGVRSLVLSIGPGSFSSIDHLSCVSIHEVDPSGTVRQLYPGDGRRDDAGADLLSGIIAIGSGSEIVLDRLQLLASPLIKNESKVELTSILRSLISSKTSDKKWRTCVARLLSLCFGSPSLTLETLDSSSMLIQPDDLYVEAVSARGGIESVPVTT
jgi:hypothetical protein